MGDSSTIEQHTEDQRANNSLFLIVLTLTLCLFIIDAAKGID